MRWSLIIKCDKWYYKVRQRDEVLCADLKESGCSLVSLWTPSYDSHLYIHYAEREAKDSYRPRSLRSGEEDCLAACASFFGLIFVKMVQKMEHFWVQIASQSALDRFSVEISFPPFILYELTHENV